MGQVVQVGAGALHEYVVRVRTKQQDRAANGQQDRRIPNGELNPG
jgi:hypothetical protein